MLKDDTKDQIPLFDLPTPDKPSAAPPAAVTVTTGASLDKPVPEKKVVPKKALPRPPARELKRAANRSTAKQGAKATAGPVPEGDVRLTANIREDLHLKLKIVAATRRTTIGELLEELVERYL